MADFLTSMVESSRHRLAELLADGEPDDRGIPSSQLRLSESGFDLLAEVKLQSPSEGPLEPASTPLDVVDGLARAYRGADVAGISVLTEPTRFGGNIDDLAVAAMAAPGIPIMRKDFLIDSAQVSEARLGGASGVLLIARILTGSQLVEMTDLALSLGMFVLVEVFDENDLETASVVYDRDILIGVNSRDLDTLQVHSARFADLAPELPGHLPAVAESGIETPSDVEVVVSLGYRLALVGTGLVTSRAPGDLATTLLRAGRGAGP